MPLFAQLPNWMIFVMFMMFVGPVMRMMFGGKRGRWGKHEEIDGRNRDEIRQLESALANRDVVLDNLQQRLSELESRLDFTERLLAERRDPAQLG